MSSLAALCLGAGVAAGGAHPALQPRARDFVGIDNRRDLTAAYDDCEMDFVGMLRPLLPFNSSFWAFNPSVVRDASRKGVLVGMVRVAVINNDGFACRPDVHPEVHPSPDIDELQETTRVQICRRDFAASDATRDMIFGFEVDQASPCRPRNVKFGGDAEDPRVMRRPDGSLFTMTQVWPEFYYDGAGLKHVQAKLWWKTQRISAWDADAAGSEAAGLHAFLYEGEDSAMAKSIDKYVMRLSKKLADKQQLASIQTTALSRRKVAWETEDLAQQLGIVTSLANSLNSCSAFTSSNFSCATATNHHHAAAWRCNGKTPLEPIALSSMPHNKHSGGSHHRGHSSSGTIALSSDSSSSSSSHGADSSSESSTMLGSSLLYTQRADDVPFVEDKNWSPIHLDRGDQGNSYPPGFVPGLNETANASLAKALKDAARQKQLFVHSFEPFVVCESDAAALGGTPKPCAACRTLSTSSSTAVVSALEAKARTLSLGLAEQWGLPPPTVANITKLHLNGAPLLRVPELGDQLVGIVHGITLLQWKKLGDESKHTGLLKDYRHFFFTVSDKPPFVVDRISNEIPLRTRPSHAPWFGTCGTLKEFITQNKEWPDALPQSSPKFWTSPACSQVAFVSSMEYADDQRSQLLISYGEGDALPRVLRIPGSDIARLFKESADAADRQRD